MTGLQPTIYMDHAATSAPKPAVVVERISKYLATEAISAGRGGYHRAEQIGREISVARAALTKLIGAESPQQIVFTSGGTESLNMVLNGLLKPGDHVIATDLEHNSVLRPLYALEQKRGISVSFVQPQADGRVAVDDFRRLIRPATRLICCVQASNVIGTIQPVAELCQWAKAENILTLIDAAQTVGHWPIDVQQIGCDFLAAPAHKGLLAPLGVGFLYLRNGVERQIEPLLFGGTGTASELAKQPLEMPTRFESGSCNVPGLLGLSAALQIVTAEFVQQESRRLHELTGRFLAGLSELPELQIWKPKQTAESEDQETTAVAVISCWLPQLDPRITESILDQHFGIEVRSGFHCAPRTHAWLGRLDQGGTVRFSLGHSTDHDQIDQAIQALLQIARSSSLT